MYKTIDYRKEAITATEAQQYKMEGKIAVVKTQIFIQESQGKTLQVMKVESEMPFVLFMNSKWHRDISTQLDKYETFDTDNGQWKANTDARVYLRGEIYYNHYQYSLGQKDPFNPYKMHEFLYIKPSYGIQFIVGDNERCF